MNQSKELFEKLGYSITQNDKVMLSYVNIEEHKEITFLKEDMIVYAFPGRANTFADYDDGIPINMSLLQAINKQCEELNWRKENEQLEK